MVDVPALGAGEDASALGAGVAAGVEDPDAGSVELALRESVT